MSVYICGRNFELNADTENHMAWIVGLYEDTEVLDTSHEKFVIMYFEIFDKKWLQKIGNNKNNIDFVFVRKLKSGRGVFCIRKMDGSFMPLSFFLEHLKTDTNYVSVISTDGSTLPNYKKILKSAMRRTVSHQIVIHKTEYFSTADKKCLVTGELILYETSQVHHHGISFSKLADDFIKLKKVTNPKTILLTVEEVTYEKITDINFMSDWLDYHLKQSDLLVLSYGGHLALHQQLEKDKTLA